MGSHERKQRPFRQYFSVALLASFLTCAGDLFLGFAVKPDTSSIFIGYLSLKECECGEVL